jgi:hypothetical protein
LVLGIGETRRTGGGAQWFHEFWKWRISAKNCVARNTGEPLLQRGKPNEKGRTQTPGLPIFAFFSTLFRWREREG